MANDGDRRTPPDSIDALDHRVAKAERVVEHSADWSLQAYQTACRCEKGLEALSRKLDDINRKGYTMPNVISSFSLIVSVIALLVACAVVR